MSNGVKYDDGKLPLDLIAPEAIIALGAVLKYGEKKYGARNWERGIAPDRLYAAALRHLVAWKLGHISDGESGLSPLAHAFTDLMMMVAQVVDPTKYGLDESGHVAEGEKHD